MKNNRIPKNLTGPERWARVAKITGESADTKPKPKARFGKHDFGNWNSKQIDNYVTAVTGIKPTKGSSRDRRAGRALGRYIKGNT